MASVNTEKTWPCIVKTRGMLFDKNSKKRHVSLCSYVKGKGLTALRSLQFSDYDTVILDEYVPDPRDQNPEATKETIRAFIKMLLDIQREKPDLKVWLFGNANSYKDAFFDYFGLSYNVESAVDRKAGLLILNLREHYIGSLESANAQRLLK
ncbi:MAG: hypothetical protein E7Y34_02900, partial [Mycoplasma sp.]|nr:hypothetical protein [Mycoplasma sp.]